LSPATVIIARPAVEFKIFARETNRLDGVTVFRSPVSTLSAVPLAGIMEKAKAVPAPAIAALLIFGLSSLRTLPNIDDTEPAPILITDCGTRSIFFAMSTAVLRDEIHALDKDSIDDLNVPISSAVAMEISFIIIPNKIIEYNSEKITFLALDFVTLFMFTADKFRRRVTNPELGRDPPYTFTRVRLFRTAKAVEGIFIITQYIF
jgi:hypothetical protein